MITIVATLNGAPVGRTGILITDDDSTSEQIKLTVSPDEINENAGATHSYGDRHLAGEARSKMIWMCS